MSHHDAKTFVLKKLVPLGFIEMKYHNKFCPICRGILTDSCSNCIENGDDACDVIKNGDYYYHRHCHVLMNNDQQK